MTSNASFKRQVRERMARTGERYTTARAQLLAARATAGPPSVSGLLSEWRRTGGVQPDVAATANALAHVGVAGLTGGAFDEVDALGLAGGIGFLYGVFVWEGYGPTLTLTTRTDSMPQATIDQILARAGVRHRVETTTSRAKAARTLDGALDRDRPCLVLLDESYLPMHDAVVDGLGNPRFVGIVGRDAGGRLLVDDQSPSVVAVDGEAIADGRAAVASAKHRMVSIEQAVADHDVRAATLDALRRTVVGYDQPPARPFASNVGSAGLATWATALRSTGTRSWSTLFDEPVLRRRAFDRTAACIDEDLAAPGGGRGMWAVFLDRAAGLLGIPDLAAIATAARASEHHWIDVARIAGAADPHEPPAATFEQLADLVDEIAAVERSLLDALADVLDRS